VYDPHVQRAIRRWRADCQIVEWSDDLKDWRLAAVTDEAERARLTHEAVWRLVDSPDLSGGILLLHDEPFGSRHAGAGMAAILDLTLEALRSKDFTLIRLGAIQ
jgi:hypothetical protein